MCVCGCCYGLGDMCACVGYVEMEWFFFSSIGSFVLNINYFGDSNGQTSLHFHLSCNEVCPVLSLKEKHIDRDREKK